MNKNPFAGKSASKTGSKPNPFAKGNPFAKKAEAKAAPKGKGIANAKITLKPSKKG